MAPRALCSSLAALLAFSLACTDPLPRGRAQLAARLDHARGVTIEAPQGLRAVAERLARRWSEGRTFRERALPARVVPPGAGAAPRVLAGAPGAPGMGQALAALGAVVEATGDLRWLERKIPAAGGVLVATLADPAAPSQPLTIVCGADEAAVARALASLEPVGWSGARVFVRGTLAFELLLDRDGTPWRSTLRDPRAERRRLLRELRPLGEASDETSSAVAVAHHPAVPAERAVRARATAATVLARARGLLGGEGRGSGQEEGEGRWALRLFARPADVELATGMLELAVVRPAARDVTALAAQQFPSDVGAALARGELERVLGPAVPSWLAEALGAELADSFWGRGLEEWCAELIEAGVFPDTSALLAPDAPLRISPLARIPAAALLVRFLREQRGDEYLRRLWQGRVALALDGMERAAFDRWRGERLAAAIGAVRAARQARRREAFGGPLRRGVVLDTLPRPGGLCTGPGFEEALTRAREAGADAAQLVATMLEHPAEERFAAPLAPRGIGFVEGDVAIAWGLARAGASGLRAMLRPQLLLSDSASYAGWAKRTTVEEWQAFFGVFERCTRHAALLATLAGAEGLALGAEMGDAARTDPAPGGERRPEVLEDKRNRWLQLARLARQIFPGWVTYLAAFPGEAERFCAWDELDRVGVLLWPDLSGGEPGPPSDAELVRRARGALARARRLAEAHGKPLLVGELGARARSRAFTDSELGPGEPDRRTQVRILDAYARAFEGESARGALAGLYLFGWDLGAEARTGFELEGEAALGAARRLLQHP